MSVHRSRPSNLDERLFQDARGLRTRLGDDAFFRQLNEGKQDAGDGWGDLGAAWDAEAFEAAMLEPPEGEERQRLVGDLITTIFTSYADVAVARGEAFVDLDTGLAIVSHHAQQLGYDAVVLFLDELILWLATRAGDVDFVSAEGAKLSKLVEAQRADRPVPSGIDHLLGKQITHPRTNRNERGEIETGKPNLHGPRVVEPCVGRKVSVKALGKRRQALDTLRAFKKRGGASHNQIQARIASRLDRVMQVGAPPSVASFLQRMGRTNDEEFLADLAIVLLGKRE
jgi:hypothetical protein